MVSSSILDPLVMATNRVTSTNTSKQIRSFRTRARPISSSPSRNSRAIGCLAHTPWQSRRDEPLPNGDLARLETQLERAKQNAAGAERLYKIGVLAKVEVEQRLLKVIRCESDLANARVARAKDELAEKESQLATGEITRDELESIKTALAQLTETAQAATTKRERAELEAAEANLRRQQKLLKLGIGQKSDVTRAEEKLADLKAQKN